MSRFLGFLIFFIIVAGLILHSGHELPWYLDWVGTLPGDLIIKKKHFTVYAPITSSLLISAVLSFLFSLVSKK